MTDNKSSAVPQRREWDVEEFAHKAREKDREERERAHENEERLRKGLKPLRKKIELPKATQEMQARDKDLELSKNQGKTLMVDGVAGGRKGPGFHCETCSRSFKDSIAYLDHVNGRLREYCPATKYVSTHAFLWQICVDLVRPRRSLDRRWNRFVIVWSIGKKRSANGCREAVKASNTTLRCDWQRLPSSRRQRKSCERKLARRKSNHLRKLWMSIRKRWP